MRWRNTTSTRSRAPSNPARRMLIRQIVIGVLLCSVVGLLLYGVWHVTRLPALTISEVTAAGGITIEPAAVVAVAEDELRGTYYRLIPRRFSYLYPASALQSRLLEIPRIKDVQLTREQRTRLTIDYTEYEPFALWCNDQGEACVFIDNTGYGFASAPTLRGAAFVRYYNRAHLPEIGVVGVDPEVLAETSVAVQTMAEGLNLRVRTITFDDRDIIFELGGDGEIRINRTDSMESTLSNLETLLDSQEFAHLEPGNFEYIDLRYGNKVFVQEELPEMATSTNATTSAVAEE